MKGDPRKPAYFRWFSLAVQRGLRITRLYEYYMETMDISYRRQLPKPLLMYFAYNDNSLGDSRKAYVYASVITYKDNDPQTYGNYKETMERFAQRKACLLYTSSRSPSDDGSSAQRQQDLRSCLFSCSSLKINTDTIIKRKLWKFILIIPPPPDATIPSKIS